MIRNSLILCSLVLPLTLCSSVLGQTQSFAQWQSGFSSPFTVRSSADNLDADQWDDLFEYAVDSSPLSGLPTLDFAAVGQSGIRAGLILEITSGGDVTAKVRPSLRAQGVGFVLQRSLDLATWTDLSTPTPVDDYLVWADVDGSDLTGYLRLMVTHGTSTSYGETQGWSKYSLAQGYQTYGPSFLSTQLFTGVVDSLDFRSIQLKSGSSEDWRVICVAGTELYLEIMDGSAMGHRLDVDFVGSTATKVQVKLAGSYPGSGVDSSLSFLPSTLVGSRFVIRAKEKLGDVFQKNLFLGGLSLSTSDQLLFWNLASWKTHYLLDARPSLPSYYYWTPSGDSSLPDVGETPLGPNRAVFVKKLSALVNFVEVGELRGWQYRRIIPPGTSLHFNSLPKALSLEDIGLFPSPGLPSASSPAAATQVQTWNGDLVAGTSGWSTYWLSSLPEPHWLKQDGNGTAQEEAPLLLKGRAFFVLNPSSVSADYLEPSLHTIPFPSNPWVDLDGDGIPDSLELQEFGNLTTAQGLIDSNGNGWLDGYELLAGNQTPPTDPGNTSTGLIIFSPRL